jgi:DNA-binding NarL/FixJ family response regulator
VVERAAERLLTGALGLPPSTASGLTPRQTEVLTHLAAGESGRTVASKMFISESTVHRHIQALYRTLGVRKRATAVMAAVSMDLIPTTEDRP